MIYDTNIKPEIKRRRASQVAEQVDFGLVFDKFMSLTSDLTDLPDTKEFKIDTPSGDSTFSTPEIMIYYLYGFCGNKKFKKAIPIIISQDESGDYIIEIPQLNIYSFADNIDDGITEIFEDIEDIIQTLKETPKEKLGEDPKRWKKFLLEHITQF